MAITQSYTSVVSGVCVINISIKKLIKHANYQFALWKGHKYFIFEETAGKSYGTKRLMIEIVTEGA